MGPHVGLGLHGTITPCHQLHTCFENVAYHLCCVWMLSVCMVLICCCLSWLLQALGFVVCSLQLAHCPAAAGWSFCPARPPWKRVWWVEPWWPHVACFMGTPMLWVTSCLWLCSSDVCSWVGEEWLRFCFQPSLTLTAGTVSGLSTLSFTWIQVTSNSVSPAFFFRLPPNDDDSWEIPTPPLQISDWWLDSSSFSQGGKPEEQPIWKIHLTWIIHLIMSAIRISMNSRELFLWTVFQPLKTDWMSLCSLKWTDFKTWGVQSKVINCVVSEKGGWRGQHRQPRVMNPRMVLHTTCQFLNAGPRGWDSTRSVMRLRARKNQQWISRPWAMWCKRQS